MSSSGDWYLSIKSGLMSSSSRSAGSLYVRSAFASLLICLFAMLSFLIFTPVPTSPPCRFIGFGFPFPYYYYQPIGQLQGSCQEVARFDIAALLIDIAFWFSIPFAVQNFVFADLDVSKA